MKNYLSIRNKFMLHIRDSIKDIPYDERVEYFKTNFISIFSSFALKGYLNSRGATLMRENGVAEFTKLYSATKKKVQAVDDRIAVIEKVPARARDDHDKELLTKLFIDRKKMKIKYRPKPSAIDRAFIPAWAFKDDGTAFDIFVKDELNIINSQHFKIDKVAGGYFVYPIPVKREGDGDFIAVHYS